jgi:transcriptional regulator with XRE-family HTH domain
MLFSVRPRRVDRKALQHLSSRLRQLRAAHGLSQRELAKKIQIGMKTLAFYEQGKMMPSLESGAKLARFFGVPMETLIYENAPADQVKDRELLEYLTKADELPHHDKSLIKDLIDALVARQVLHRQKTGRAAA